MEIVDRDNEWGVENVSRDERKYLAKSFQKVKRIPLVKTNMAEHMSLSDKATKILEALLREPTGFAGIVFVQERAMVAVVYHLITLHPQTRGKFRAGTSK